MDSFHPAVQRWFSHTFEAPTPIQAGGWPAIAAGGDVLLSAPTGSGKTLAAFLWFVDRRLRQPGGPSPQVLYVSPLKALGNDIERNLREPLRGIQQKAGEAASIRVAVRSGDSLPADRRRLLTRPPDILITTPESLYLLLGARRSRPILRGLQAVIVDEIHALAPNKRGAHLSLSLARLDRLCGRRLQRIGLSATQKPLSRMAEFLSGDVPCTLVETPLDRPRQLSIFCPSLPLSAVASQEHWAEVCDRLAEVIRQHRTTLIFTHTRRLAERLTRQLAERVGAERVAAHHGSLARERRLDAEVRLKRGELAALVATASMELGIDVGHIDIVCHVGAPRSVGNLLQRIGRSGRSLGTDSTGLLVPLTRDDLVQCAAAVQAAHRGELEALEVPPGGSDVLAQQLVAASAAEPDGLAWADLVDLVRSSYVYRNFPDAALRALVAMVSEGRRPLLYWDRIHDRLHGRPGTLATALTGGGAIPDTADYDVVELPSRLPVGKLNEDFAIESMAGDVFVLGSTAWRIRQVTSSQVYVEAAPGQNATIPFWLGEAPGRSRELSRAVAALRLEAAQGVLGDDTGLDETGREQLLAYVRETLAVLGRLPSFETVVAERFFDDSGGMQLIIHSPFGMRINRAWGLALRKRFCVTFDFELQAAATDDGVLLSLSRRHSFELSSVFGYVQPESVHKDLVATALQGPVFGQRWRDVATRSLLLPRARHGKKVPVAIQRMRAEDLLASVFPDQVMCQDNRSGPVEPPDHPLVMETLAECLQGWMDESGLRQVAADLRSGALACHAVDTVSPSPLSHGLLHAMPYAFLDDAPLEERRARAVSTWGAASRPLLDEDAIRLVARDAWPRVVDAHGLHQVLERLGWVGGEDLVGQEEHLATLLSDGRVVPTERGGRVVYAAAQLRYDRRSMVQGWMECLGPVTVQGMSRRTGLPVGDIDAALLELETQGLVLQGHFTPGVNALEWCHRDTLARIHRETLRRARAAVAPASLEQWSDFVQAYQQREPVEDAIGQLQGLEMSPQAWLQICSSRTAELEMQCLTGLLGWSRLSAVRPAVETVAVSNPLFMPSSTPRRRLGDVGCFYREAYAWLAHPEPATVSGRAAETLSRLAERGASFTQDLGGEAVGEALEELAALGRASSDGLAPWRGQMQGRWFAWPLPPASADRVEQWARQLLKRYGIVFRRLLDFEACAPAWGELRRVYSLLELRGEVLAGRFVSDVAGEQYGRRDAIELLRAAAKRPQPLADGDPIRQAAMAVLKTPYISNTR